MFKVINKKETSMLLERSGHEEGFSAELRRQFSSMDVGESFIYPYKNGVDKNTVRYKIGGTCRHIGAKISTKVSSEGLIVIFLGYK